MVDTYDDNHIIVDKALLVIMLDLPMGKTVIIDDFIQKAKIFMDVHDLWLEDAKKDDEAQEEKPLEKRIIRLCSTLKHLLNIRVDHKASMAFRDFIKLAINHMQ